MKTKKSKSDWFDSHVIVEGPGLSAKDKQHVRDTLKKLMSEAALPLDKPRRKNLRGHGGAAE